MAWVFFFAGSPGPTRVCFVILAIKMKDLLYVVIAKRQLLVHKSEALDPNKSVWLSLLLRLVSVG